MTPAEKQVIDRLKAAEYTVINKGWPDLLAERNGEVIAIEVKGPHDEIKPHQRECHRMLKQAGINVTVEYVTDMELETVKVKETMRRAYNPTDSEVSESVNRAFETAFPGELNSIE